MCTRLFGIAIAMLVMATGADAQLAGLLAKSLGLPADGEAGGSYQSKNQLRTYITSEPYNDALLYRELIGKASDMAGAKGFSRIGVTKTKCTTVVTSGVPRSTTCYLIAVMLNDGETAAPRGDRDVQYYDVSDGKRGLTAPGASPR